MSIPAQSASPGHCWRVCRTTWARSANARTKWTRLPGYSFAMRHPSHRASPHAILHRGTVARGPTKAPAAQTGTYVLAHRATGSRNGTVFAEIHPSSEVIDATLLQATVERPARRERCARANSFHRCGQD